MFHFIGHGGFNPRTNEGHIALASEDGSSFEFSAIQLSRLLGDCQTLRLAVLNACEGARGSGADLFSSTAAILVRHGLPAVVSMQQEISDQAAIQFAREFYRTLALEYPVDAAVAEARKAMSFALPDSVEWGTPVLHMRSPDGRLFRVGGRTSGDSLAPPREPQDQPDGSRASSGDVRKEEDRLASKEVPFLSSWLSTRALKVLTVVQLIGTVAGLATSWASPGRGRLGDIVYSKMLMFWVFLSITGAVLAWQGLRRSTWSGVLLGFMALIILPLYIVIRTTTLTSLVASVLIATASGVTLLKRLPAHQEQRARIPRGREWAFMLWTCAQTMAILLAAILTLNTQDWSVVVLSGVVLGLVALNYEVWPAVVLGWSAALVSPPFLTFLQLKLRNAASPGWYYGLWSYIALSLVLCVWTLIVVRRRRSARQ